jgi:hypothetical protein
MRIKYEKYIIGETQMEKTNIVADQLQHNKNSLIRKLALEAIIERDINQEFEVTGGVELVCMQMG